MPISTIDPKALERLRPADVVGLALAADQESRRQMRLGNMQAAREWDAESERLCAVFRAT